MSIADNVIEIVAHDMQHKKSTNLIVFISVYDFYVISETMQKTFKSFTNMPHKSMFVKKIDDRFIHQKF